MSQSSRLRLVVLGVLVLSLTATLLARLWYMQALAGDTYAARAANTNTRDILTLPARGLIVDDMGRPLAANNAALVVSVDLSNFPGTGSPLHDVVLARLAKLLGQPGSAIEAKITLCDYKTYGANATKHDPGCWNGSPLQPIPLVSLQQGTQASTQLALEIAEKQEDYPGVIAQVQSVRNYPSPDGISAVQLLGHVSTITGDDLNATNDKDWRSILDAASRIGGVIGHGGLEEEYDKYLFGTMGKQTVAIDRRGSLINTLGETAAVPGDWVVTSIDSRVQKLTEEALADAVHKAQTVPQQSGRNQGKTVPAPNGAAVVVDVKTGRIIAMANYPTYDPNLWVGGISAKNYQTLLDDPGKPLLFQAVQGQYAPGSTFKPLTTVAAIRSGMYSLSGRYTCPTRFYSGNRPFQNFDGETGEGNITFDRAIEISCDTFFYAIGAHLWDAGGGAAALNAPEYILKTAMDFGLGKPTGIDLPDDSDGNLTTREDLYKTWQRNKSVWCAKLKAATDAATKTRYDELCNRGYYYYQGEALNVAIGQGTTLVTPLQLAMAYSAIANGGTLFTPRIGKAVVSAAGKLVKEITPPSHKIDASPHTLAYIRDALHKVVNGGTAANAFSSMNFPFDKLDVGGKTGTAEAGTDAEPLAPTAWFASIGGPANQPAQYAIVMMVDQGGTGGSTSAPYVAQLWEGIYGYGKYASQGPAMPNGTPPTALPDVPTVTENMGATPTPTVSPTPTPTPSRTPSGEVGALAIDPFVLTSASRGRSGRVLP